jgi:hypothetical protein
MIFSFSRKKGKKGKKRFVFFLLLSISLISLGQPQTFTSSGSYTVPASVTSIIVECWGAGGGGGSSNTNGTARRAGGGGGGGGYSSSTIAVVPGTVYNIVVGTGGTGGVAGNGGNGTTSTFNTNTVVANGGNGGGRGSAGSGGAGGALGTGNNRYTGGNGAAGVNATGSGGGGGGAGSTGNGGNASGTSAGTGSSTNGGNGGAGVTTSVNGNNGNNYGGGGSGGNTLAAGTERNGGTGANGLVVITGCNTASMGYSYERNITIDYTKVAGGKNLNSFPLLINLTGQTFLKTIPAGQVVNTNGYDIIFTDANYNMLDHQIEYYNGTNGDLIAWVRIPVLSYSANTVIKILYGNPQVTTDPSVTSVWDSHYKGVWHLDNGSLNDFTSNNKSGTTYNSPTYQAGKIYNSIGLNGTNQYAEVLNDPAINFAGNITVSAWVNMGAGSRDQKIASNQNNSTGGYKFGIYTNNKVEFEIRNAANTPSLNRDEPGGTTLTTATWYYLAGISSDVLDSIKTFVNGTPERPFKKIGTLGPASNTLTISKEPFESNYYFNGKFDELRISDEVRSNGWMKTEFNNQSSPSTFYTVDASGVASNYLPSESRCSGPITLTFGYPAGGTYSGNSYIAGNIFTPPSAGTYSIMYTYTGSCGTTNVTKNFIVTDAPPAPLAANKEYCSNQITYLEATSGQNYQWYLGATLVSNANPYSTGQNTPGTYNYSVTQTLNDCESAHTPVTLTVYGGVSITTNPLPLTICSNGNAVFTVAATGYNLTYQWQESGTNITNGGIYSGATTASLTLTTPGTAKSGKTYNCVVTTSCGPPAVSSTAALLTVTALPVATFSYTGNPYCPNAANPSPNFGGVGVAGTFSSTSGLVFVSTATGVVNIAASTPGTYTVTNTIAASGGCGIVTATSPITITSNLAWSGAVSTDWNATGNWQCGCLPKVNISAQVPNVARKPVLSTGAVGAVNNLVVDNSSSLTISGNTLQIAGTITNNGTLTATAGTIAMNGSAAQTIGAGVFATNTIKDLIINNTAGVSLLGPLNITGIVTVQSGNLSSGDNLTLISTAAQTALIAGSGTANITGNVTMQRYLPSGFGYKYFSSPFQAATVNEFGDDMTLGSFTFYKYDESLASSGWVSYQTPTTNVLFPLQGYAVNFGAVSSPVTLDVTGATNNGTLSATLYNHNNTYTKGFNLVGNPYPSPIDWNAAAGWTKTNIDNALYYFKASTTDQYGGTYSSYINGISSDGIANNIIPSMQGFFIHVTDGAWPVTGTLAVNNSVRITDLTHAFAKSLNSVSIPLLRLASGFSDDTASTDPVVIYFDEQVAADFDNQLDALKLLNTDLSVANLYIVNPDGAQLSIKALQPVTDYIQVPLGLKLNRDGIIAFRIRDIDESLTRSRIYLTDIATGIDQDLLPAGEYRVSLASGEYDNRFFLNFSNITTGVGETKTDNDLFSIYSSLGNLKAEINILEGERGNLKIYNLFGQIIYIVNIHEKGYHEFSPGLKEGIYFIRYSTGLRMSSKKIFIQNR